MMNILDKEFEFKLNGESLKIRINRSDYGFFETAIEKLNERLTELKLEYGAFANSESLISVLALEATYEALMINERYQKLKIEVDSRLESIQANFDN